MSCSIEVLCAHLFGPGDALFKRHAELDAELVRDRLRLTHHRGGELARQRVLADVDEGRMAQAADRVECQVAPQLEPDLGADLSSTGP
jgi:hypothetical protein